MSVRLGILGGSFDPPHVGHLLVAIDAVEQLGLECLLVVPAGVQPLKGGSAVATRQQRLAMVEALTSMDARLRADPVEVNREGPSYAVDTLTDVARRYPSAERFFLVGADVIPTFPKWRSPDRIAEFAQIVVLRRGNEPLDSSALPAGSTLLPTRRVDVSSTEVRDRIGRGAPIRGFVPEPVANYIAAEQLYRPRFAC